MSPGDKKENLLVYKFYPASVGKVFRYGPHIGDFKPPPALALVRIQDSLSSNLQVRNGFFFTPSLKEVLIYKILIELGCGKSNLAVRLAHMCSDYEGAVERLELNVKRATTKTPRASRSSDQSELDGIELYPFTLKDVEREKDLS